MSGATPPAAKARKNYNRKGFNNRKTGVCSVCGTPGKTEPHHIVPRSAGGGDHKENLLELCVYCHPIADWVSARAVAQVVWHMLNCGPEHIIEWGISEKPNNAEGCSSKLIRKLAK